MKKGKITAELKRIAKSHGGILKPEIVVKVAENKKNVLYNCFQWDNTKAGHAYRLWQARQLISVSVEYSEIAQQNYEVFVSLSNDRKLGGYREVENVLSNKALRQIMLNDAVNEMNLFIEKYNKLKELAQVFESMSKATAKHSKKTVKSKYNTIYPTVSPVAV